MGENAGIWIFLGVNPRDAVPGLSRYRVLVCKEARARGDLELGQPGPQIARILKAVKVIDSGEYIQNTAYSALPSPILSWVVLKTGPAPRLWRRRVGAAAGAAAGRHGGLGDHQGRGSAPARARASARRKEE